MLEIKAPIVSTMLALLLLLLLLLQLLGMVC
jgi:hypothetical protein